MEPKKLKSMSEDIANKKLIQRGRLRSQLFHNGGDKVHGVALDHIIEPVIETLEDMDGVGNLEPDEVNGPVAHGIVNAIRSVLFDKAATPTWQQRREGLVLTEPVELKGYWKCTRSRKDTVAIPGDYKRMAQHQTNSAMRYNSDCVTAGMAYDKDKGPEDTPLFSERFLAEVKRIGFIAAFFTAMNIFCRVLRLYENTKGDAGIQGAKAGRFSIEWYEGRKATSRHKAVLRREAKAAGWSKRVQRDLGDNTLDNRVAFLKKYSGNMELLRFCLEFIYIAETKMSHIMIHRDVHTSMICHILAALRYKKIAQVVDMDNAGWFNRHDHFFNTTVDKSRMPNAAPFFANLQEKCPELVGLFKKPPFTPYAHGSGTKPAMLNSLDSDEKHWNYEAPDLMDTSLSIEQYVAQLSSGMKTFEVPHLYKLALKTCWPGWARRKVITTEEYKAKLMIIFEDLKKGFRNGFGLIDGFNKHGKKHSKAMSDMALAGRVESIGYTNDIGFSYEQARWKRNPNNVKLLKNTWSPIEGEEGTSLSVYLAKRERITGSEYPVNVAQSLDALYNTHINLEFEEAGKDIKSIHDNWVMRLEDVEWFDTEVSPRCFFKTHGPAYLNECGWDVAKKLPKIRKDFAFTLKRGNL